MNDYKDTEEWKLNLGGVRALVEKNEHLEARVKELETSLQYNVAALRHADETLVKADQELKRLHRENKWLGELRDQLYNDKALLIALRKEDGEDMQRLSDQLDYLSDENAKLQAALTRIATMPPVNEEFGYQGYDADKMAAIARDALEVIGND